MTDRKLQLEDWLDDLCVRFIINLPQDDLSDPARLGFQIEEAQWYYEDWIRPLDPKLPPMSLRNFFLRILLHCPITSQLSRENHLRTFDHFREYKGRIPVRGAILLNADLDCAVLVKGWKKGGNWGFPRGKINKDEDDLDCAIREVHEEIGYDLDAAGLVPKDRQVKYIDANVKEQRFRLFVFRDVPMDTKFETQTRKEIGDIKWWRLSDLPNFKKKSQQQEGVLNSNKFFMVTPFLPQLRRWVIDQKRQDGNGTANNQYLTIGAVSPDEGLTEDDLLGELDMDFDDVPEASGLAGLEGQGVAAHFNLLASHSSTQMLQSTIGRAVQSSISKSSGQQLLDILHSAPPPKEPIATELPRAAPPPQDYPINQPYPPKLHHDPAPLHPQVSNIPPPNFPLQHGQQNPPNHTYEYQQPKFHMHQQHYSQANVQYRNQIPQQNPQPQFRPLSNPPTLIHPQPLPPNVQKALFTGGIVHSPMVPQPTQQPPMQFNSTLPTGNRIPQFPYVHATMVPPQQKEPPQALNSHSLALLNAFKNRDQGTKDLPSKSAKQNTAHAPPSHVQELPAESSQPKPASITFVTNVSQTAIPRTSVQELNANTVSQKQVAKPAITDSHRTTLLGIFKSPPTQTMKPTTTAAAVALPTSSSPSAVELSAVQIVSPPGSGTAASSNGASALHQAHQLPVMNPESNLPFRAMSILTRPASGHREMASKNTVPFNDPTAMRPTSKGSFKTSSEDKSFQPQILRRPQSSGIKLPNGPGNTTPSLAQSSLFPSQPAQSPQQKQALLSLFGKLPSSSDSTSNTSKPYGALPKPSVEDANNLAARSRVGSLASGNGDPTSRRGSQTPISPADKGFLLNYLDAVASRGY